MNDYRTITGYCQTQKRNYSVVLTCIDSGMGSYLKGTIIPMSSANSKEPLPRLFLLQNILTFYLMLPTTACYYLQFPYP